MRESEKDSEEPTVNIDWIIGELGLRAKQYRVERNTKKNREDRR